jgi:hypothetical protein
MMAKHLVLLCDFDQGGCGKPAESYRLWRDGDTKAAAIDLCEEHAAPLLAVIEGAEQVDLPVKPRARMEVTKLLTTPKTAHLKKKG